MCHLLSAARKYLKNKFSINNPLRRVMDSTSSISSIIMNDQDKLFMQSIKFNHTPKYQTIVQCSLKFVVAAIIINSFVYILRNIMTIVN